MSERISDERLAVVMEMAESTTPPRQRDEWRDLIACLKDYASLREQTRWRPMEEAPKDGTTILALLDGSDLVNVVRYHDGGWVVAWDHYRLDGANLQFWMPLPEIGPLPTGEAK